MGIKLIGITGKARSGKDTFAQTLTEEHGFQRMAFADPLKQATAAAFGWKLAALFDEGFKEHEDPFWKVKVRRALQVTGDIFRHTFGDDHWVRRWLIDYAPIMDKVSVVVTDVRSDAEADAIRTLGGIIIHLKRNGAGLSGAEALHRSESGIRFSSKHDVTVENNGTIEDLALEAHKIVRFVEENAAQFGLRNVKVEH